MGPAGPQGSTGPPGPPAPSSGLQRALAILSALIAAISAGAAGYSAKLALDSYRVASVVAAASQRAAVVDSINKAIDLAATNEKYAPRLFLALRQAAELEAAGLTSDDDAAALRESLEAGNAQIRHDDKICAAWAKWSKAHAPRKELQALVNALVDPAGCPKPREN